ncbi:hypothetical protein FEZ51_02055 [Pediococcus stilesii]|uniref:Uncharacterized protein n=2 Tax=Pediococcus stilesii TaxID=331679 RepID=A0A5R9BXK4_9LACO|nr:hypothetical protein FEZ51_02055 [Pediococcus stilesii]
MPLITIHWSVSMAKLIHSKFGYETKEWIQADAKLEKWLKKKKKSDPKKDCSFNLPKKERKTIKIEWRG